MSTERKHQLYLERMEAGLCTVRRKGCKNKARKGMASCASCGKKQVKYVQKKRSA